MEVSTDGHADPQQEVNRLARRVCWRCLRSVLSPVECQAHAYRGRVSRLPFYRTHVIWALRIGQLLANYCEVCVKRLELSLPTPN